MKRAWILAAALWLAGCAHAPGRAQLSLAEPQVCKHCNCYLPAGIQDDARCTVCNCGHRAGECYRGR